MLSSNSGPQKGSFSYRGKFFNVTAPDMDPVKDRGFYMKPYQKPHPPIGVAATSLGSTSIRLAGERGWIPMSSSLLAPIHLKDHWRMVEAGAASAGREVDRRRVAHWPGYFRGRNASPGA